MLGHVVSPSILIGNFVSTVVACFDMSVAMTEWGAEIVADSICDSIFRVYCMTRVRFLNFKLKLVTINDSRPWYSFQSPNLVNFR